MQYFSLTLLPVNWPTATIYSCMIDECYLSQITSYLMLFDALTNQISLYLITHLISSLSIFISISLSLVTRYFTLSISRSVLIIVFSLSFSHNFNLMLLLLILFNCGCSIIGKSSLGLLIAISIFTYVFFICFQLFHSNLK